MKACLDVELIVDAGDWSRFHPAPELVKAAADALTSLVALNEHSAVVVALSSDAEVQRLNTAYRGQAKPTNVLSFPTAPMPRHTGGDGPRHLGDVVIALETMEAEARSLGIPLQHHVQHLVVHGLLHLLGYDHENDEDADVMEGLETQTMARLGIADPYADPSGAAEATDARSPSEMKLES